MEEVDFDEKAFDMIGSNAPQDVKDAWMEAAKEVNANGLGIKGNGMLSHISQMMVQRLNKQMKGEDDVDNIDILGNTTESAIQATKQALYDLDHPKEYVPKSIEASLYERKRILCCVSGKISKVIIHKTKKMQRCILSTIIHFCIFLF